MKGKTNARENMDLLLSPILGPTAEIPLLEGPRLDMVKALRKGDSYWDLTRSFPDIICRLSGLSGTIDCRRTILVLENIEDEASTAWAVLHAVPRNVMASIVLGTVAYDFNKTHHRPSTYSDRGPGVYAIGISVNGRDGKWLTAKELRKLVRELLRYRDAYLAWKEHQGNPVTVQDTELHDFVMQVDNMVGQSKTAGNPPRFVHDDAGEDLLASMIGSFTERFETSLRLDPAGDKPMAQSPIYVGCSNDLETRVPQHKCKPVKSSMALSNKAMTLTLAMMSFIDREGATTARTVLRTWKNNQLAVAEMLVAALANSYMTLDGFNRTEAGDREGNLSQLVLQGCSASVLGQQPYFYENITQSCEAMREEFEQIFKMAALAPLFDDSSTVTTVLRAAETAVAAVSGNRRLDQRDDDMLAREGEVSCILSQAQTAVEDKQELLDAITNLVVNIK